MKVIFLYNLKTFTLETNGQRKICRGKENILMDGSKLFNKNQTEKIQLILSHHQVLLK